MRRPHRLHALQSYHNTSVEKKKEEGDADIHDSAKERTVRMFVPHIDVFQ